MTSARFGLLASWIAAAGCILSAAGCVGDDVAESLGNGPDGGPEGDAATDAGTLSDASLASDAAPADASSATDGGFLDAAAGDDGGDASDASTCTTSASCKWSTLETLSSCADAAVSQACEKGCASAACNTTCEAPAVVIQQLVANDYVSIAPWQSFQVATTGVLTALALRPNVYSSANEPSDLTLSIYQDEGVAGTRVYQHTYTLASASGAPMHEFVLTSPVALQAGMPYTWEVQGAKGIYYGKDDPYPSGRSSVADYDMVFKATFAACH